MYYNRILRVWVVDPIDYFLLSALLGSLLASYLKDYVSEKRAMKRLKNSIIKKSKLVSNSDSGRSTPSSKEIRLRKVYKVAFGARGGQFEGLQADYEFSNEVFKLANDIRKVVEKLAIYLKQRELKGIAKIFFKHGRLVLDLVLYKCNINLTYVLLNQGINTQVIVITATAGGAAGFTLSWFTAGATLVSPPLLLSVLGLRSIGQQITNHFDYLKFKERLMQVLNDEEIRATLRAVFVDNESPRPVGIKMNPWEPEKNPLPDLGPGPNQSWEEVIKNKVKEEFGLIENPTPEQIEEIIDNRKFRKKGRTVYFRDFINEVAKDQDGIDIIDAEIVEEAKEAIKIKVKNEEF